MSEYTGPLTATQAEPTIWFDDLEVDQTFDLGSVVAEHDDVIEFAKRFDPQWYHVDEAAAQSSHWGQITASGWWTASSMMRLYVDGFLSKIAPDASPGMENVRWHKAVYVGDELRAQLVEMSGGRRTVPQIFIGGEAIGGYSDMMALHQKGQLDPKLAG